MKPRLHPANPGSGHASAAFTLTELLICSALFMLLVGGVVSANLFGLRMFQLTENKLNASDSARKAIGRMTDEIRSCKSTFVGSISSNTFVAVADGSAQAGDGIMICPTTNTANYVLYFVNPADQTFRRTTNLRSTTTILARSVTNSGAIFRVQDHLGNVLTNNQNNRVIHLTLEFYQPKRFTIAPDSYRLETSVTRRATE